MGKNCVFCDIIANREPSEKLYDDEDFVVFRNHLNWAPVMLLVIKKHHSTQQELWSDVSSAGRLALKMGQDHCPGGFRLISNFGRDAMQSQEHGHIHVIGGRMLAPYVKFNPFGFLKKNAWPVNVVEKSR